MHRVSLTLLLVGIFAAACATKIEGPEQAETKSTNIVTFSELKWTALPEMPGMEVALLSGEPKTGAYTEMRRVRAGTDNGPHTHSSEITDVVISGVWYMGSDAASAKDLGPGGVGTIPANTVHVSGCRPGIDCIFYHEGKGRFEFIRATPSQ